MDVVVISVPTVGCIQGSRAVSRDDMCVLTEVLTLLVITQVRSGLKKYSQS